MTLIPVVESLSNDQGYISEMYGIESLTVCTFDLGSFANYSCDSLNRGYFTIPDPAPTFSGKLELIKIIGICRLSYIECKVLFKVKRF